VLFPGVDPVGRHVEIPAAPSRPAATFQVVGVVAGQRERLADAAPVAHIYRPIGSGSDGQIAIRVRLGADGGATPAEAMRQLRDVVRASAPRLAMMDVCTFAEARDRVPSTWLIRAGGAAFGALGSVALAMAVIGLYGVKAYLVARRSREIGIRMALGASPRGLVGMVLRDGSVTLGAGVLAGFVLALCAGFLVRGLLVGVRPLDPAAFLLSTAVLVLAVAAACYLPARRATRVDPTVAMRSE